MRIRRRLGYLLFSVCILVGIGSAYLWLQRPEVRGPVEIFHGVTYEVQAVPETEGNSGLAHIVRVDLSAAGVEPFVTPVDSSAVERGYQYRLAYPWWIARREGLAVTINGAHFDRNGRWYWPGQQVNSRHTAVANGAVSHVSRHSRLLWIDDEGRPRIDPNLQPPADVLQRARWGIGSGDIMLRDGRPRPTTHGPADRRTLLGVDTERRLLWLAVFEHASYKAATEVLAEAGARNGIILDGGGSTAMYIGPKAAGNVGGHVLGGWRPVATHVGIRAHPVKRSTAQQSTSAAGTTEKTP